MKIQGLIHKVEYAGVNQVNRALHLLALSHKSKHRSTQYKTKGLVITAVCMVRLTRMMMSWMTVVQRHEQRASH